MSSAEERVLVTTLTKKMAEDLTDYLFEQGIKARYLHSDIGTLERVEILRDLRAGRVRLPCRHQPAARGPRSARGLARGDPRRGQGGLPAKPPLAHPDHRASGSKRLRAGHHVCGSGDAVHAHGHRGDGPSSRAAGAPTTKNTASSRRRSARRSPTSSSTRARVRSQLTTAAEAAKELSKLPRDEVMRLIIVARGGDVSGGRGA